MPITTRTGRPNRHEKIAQVLLSGNVVSPDEIRACFTGTDQEKVLYRLPTNIYNIKRDGGIIKVHKSGRNVTGYQLINPQAFNAAGRYIGAPATNSETVEVNVEVNNTKETVTT